MPSRNRARAWTVYSTDGTPIAEMSSTSSAIRATLPNAIIDEDQGIVRMVPAPDLGLSWRPVDEAKVGPDFDAE